ncbi:hypothetical protein ULG90_02550 [Halopseudomonas pachastrellae]|nr:hypothetical protein ULG90_02550 [Halopseudomonas pachastrellae]
MSFDQKHPGENNMPHLPLPELEPPHDHWEGPIESEELNELDAGRCVVPCATTTEQLVQCAPTRRICQGLQWHGLAQVVALYCVAAQ